MNNEWRKFIAAILVAVILFASIVAILFAFGLFTPAKPAHAEHLNEHGIPTKRGGRWWDSTVRAIMLNCQ